MGQGTGCAPYKNPFREEADFCITKREKEKMQKEKIKKVQKSC